MKTFWCAIALIFAHPAWSAEADYFTNRYPLVPGNTLSTRENELSYLYKLENSPKLTEAQVNAIVRNMQTLPDSLQAMNRQMNKELDRAAATTSSCNTGAFHDLILKQMGGFLIAEIERWSYTNIDIKTYAPFNPKNNFGTVYANAGARGCCADILKINGTLLSLDKLGHFISHGFEYFEISRRKSSSPLEAIGAKMNKSSLPFAAGLYGIEGAKELGHRQEAGAWGKLSSGIYSYGDLAANYDGMRFWHELTEGQNPYFVCQNSRYKRVRDFNWADYVTDAWDEAINCNEYGSDALQNAVASRVQEIQKASGKLVTTCPVEPNKCSPLKARYGHAASHVLHPSCLKLAPVINLKTATEPGVAQ